MAIHEIYSNKNAIRVCGNNTYYKKFFTADSLADVDEMNTHGKGFLRHPAGTAVLCFEDSTVYVLTRDDNPYGEVNDEENAEFIPMGDGVTPQQLQEALATKQDLLTAGTGIGITEDEIRVTYGEDSYDDTPAFDGTMDQHAHTGLGTIYWGYAANDGDDPITEDDYLKVVADASGEGLTFSDFTDGDAYQQAVVTLSGMLPSDPPATMQYGSGVNCHGLYVSEDLSSVYLVSDAAGTEQTEPAFVLGLATVNGEAVIVILSNTNYVESGTYTVTKGTPPLKIPNTALDFSVVSKKPSVLVRTAPTAITLADNTEYYLTNVSDLSVTYPSGRFESWIRLTTATSGTVTIELPTSQYIGTAPTFGNGETWEISIKDGVVAAAKVGDET